MGMKIEISRKGDDAEYYPWGTYDVGNINELNALLRSAWEFGVHKQNYQIKEKEEKKEELKPCPFCGSRNVKIDKCVSRARCGDCMATSGLITKYINQGMDNQAALKAAWNKRADG